MQFDELVEEVKLRANLQSDGEAITAIRATLETLAERINRNEAAHLAAHLPFEVRRCLLRAPSEPVEEFSAEEFYRRVTVRESRDASTGIKHARSVVGALSSAAHVSDLRFRLPPDYAPLFEPSGAASDS